MSTLGTDHDLTLWMTDDVPTRMVYAGRRWRVSDTPTPLRGDARATPPGAAPLRGWRFQATDEEGEAVVFDVYRRGHDWHVHRCYT